MKKNADVRGYEEILRVKYRGLKRRGVTMEGRAAQFAPFAALKG